MAALAPANRQTAIAEKASRKPATVRRRIGDILMAHAKHAKLAKKVPLSVLSPVGCVLSVRYSFGTYPLLTGGQVSAPLRCRPGARRDGLRAMGDRKSVV